jgi:hypothetical protein
VLFDLEPGVIGELFRPGNLVNQNADAALAPLGPVATNEFKMARVESYFIDIERNTNR